jgi:hypothetical protein
MMTPLPQGVRCTLTAYITNGDDVEVAIAIGSFKLLPGALESVDATNLARSAGLLHHGSDWRVMTDAEIIEYLAGQENAQ